MSGLNSETSKQQWPISNPNQPIIPEKDPQSYHNIFVKYLILIISCCGSVWYSSYLCTGAVIDHLKDKFLGREKRNKYDIEQKSHGYIPRKAYDNLSKMKPTQDLQYYLQELGLDLQEYHVTTSDGFILTVHRIIDPKETDDQRQQRKPVFMQHGLISSSGNWIVSGKNSLGYYFHEQGYDVWLGNSRSNFRAKHATLKGGLYNNEQYWDWGVQELAYYDLPAMIETVLAHKEKFKKLILLGHLQGGLQSFLMLKNPYFKTMHEKIELFVPIAPAIYPGSMFYTCNFIKFMHGRGKFSWLMLFGCCAFMRNLCLIRYYLAGYSLYGKLAYYICKHLFGWYGSNWGQDRKVRHFLFVFVMSYVSMELMKYYLSQHSEYGFSIMIQPKSAYDNDEHFKINVVDDSKSFFQFDKTWFTDVKVPMILFIGKQDYLVDGKKVAEHMRKYEPGYIEGQNFEVIELEDYHHVDVVWAEDVIGTVGYIIIDKLNKMEQTKKQKAQELVDNLESVVKGIMENIEECYSSKKEALDEKERVTLFDENNLGIPDLLKSKPIIRVHPLELEKVTVS